MNTLWNKQCIMFTAHLICTTLLTQNNWKCYWYSMVPTHYTVSLNFLIQLTFESFYLFTYLWISSHQNYSERIIWRCMILKISTSKTLFNSCYDWSCNWLDGQLNHNWRMSNQEYSFWYKFTWICTKNFTMSRNFISLMSIVKFVLI